MIEGSLVESHCLGLCVTTRDDAPSGLEAKDQIDMLVKCGKVCFAMEAVIRTVAVSKHKTLETPAGVYAES